MWRFGIAVSFVAFLIPSAALAAENASDPVTGSRLVAKLDAPLTASWLNVELRTLARRVSENKQVALLLDRRIDPNRPYALESRDESLRQAVTDLAERADAAVSVTHGVVYIGPPDAAARLRTLIALRTEEIPGQDAGPGLRATGRTPREKPPATRRSVALMERRTVAWDDLDEPRALVRRIAALWKLDVENVDSVAHDLWAAGTLPEATAAEALTLVLNQFDLTFAWTDGGNGIRIVPVVGEASVERRYTPKGTKAAEAAARWTDEISGLVATADGNEVRVRGTIEQHEAVQDLLKPVASTRTPSSTASKTKKAAGPPLKRRTFTLRTQDVPASAILQKLADSGLTIRYDADRLKAGGIDLEKRIALDLDKASVDDLFDAICTPVGLRHKIDGETITLSPK